MNALESHPPFPGLREEAFEFLRDLASNNEREWLKAHKDVYEQELKAPFSSSFGRPSPDARDPTDEVPGPAIHSLFAVRT